MIGIYEARRIVESTLEQIGAKGIIRRHLQYSNHRDTPVTYHVYAPYPGQFDVVVVYFNAIVSADHRAKGAFRWPTDDCWVVRLEGSMAFHISEFEGWTGKAEHVITQRVHACGIDMQGRVPEYATV